MLVFYKEHQKVINIFLCSAFFIFTLYALYSFRLYGQEETANLNHRIKHLHITKAISKNMETECTVFSNQDIIGKKLEQMANKSGLTHSIGSEKVVQINQLTFNRVIFQTIDQTNSASIVISRGYMVLNQSTQKCFGII